jgi:hypothetical protein
MVANYGGGRERHEFGREEDERRCEKGRRRTDETGECETDSDCE